MNLADARVQITHALGRMNSLYHEAVFNEWILVKISNDHSSILIYEGPRSDTYQKKFKEDLVPLRVELAQQKLAVGDFAFAQDAAGTGFDSCVRLGPASYLFCNNTGKSMEEIRQNPLWLTAQKPFATLSEKFREDPLV